MGRGSRSRKRGPHPGTKPRSRRWRPGARRERVAACGRGAWVAGGRVWPSSGAALAPTLKAPTLRAGRSDRAPGPRRGRDSRRKPGPTGGWRTLPEPRGRALCRRWLCVPPSGGRCRPLRSGPGGSEPASAQLCKVRRPTVERDGFCEANLLRFSPFFGRSALSLVPPGLPDRSPRLGPAGPLQVLG